MSLLKIAISAVGLASTVTAHGFVKGASSNGKAYPVYNPYSYERLSEPSVVWPSNENKKAFVQAGNYDGPDIVCHVNSSPANQFLEAAAGDSINLQWTDWPKSHVGPVITYLAPAGADDFAQVDKVNLEFVKIEELGLIRNSTDPKNKPEGYYAANKLIDDGNKWTVQIPSYVAPGNYILRHEIIALMGAKDLNHAQHYPQCINIKVTGNGNDPLASGVRAKDFYNAADPGIQVMIYIDLDYKIPGPPLYKPNGAAPKADAKVDAKPVGSSASTSPENVASSTADSPTAASPTADSSTAAISTVASPTEIAQTTPVAIPSTTLVNIVSSIPLRPNNATVFPSFAYLPSKSRAAASHPSSTPSSTPSEKSHPEKADSTYTYDLPGLNNGKTEKEDGVTETGQTEGTTEQAETEKTEGTTEPVKTGPPAGVKQYNYSPAANGGGNPSTSKPVSDTTSPLSAEDFELPKNATVDQLIAFLEKLVKLLKEKVLGEKRKYARDFSMK